MDKLKLKWKVFIFLLTFCGFLLFILWLFQMVFLNDMYKMIRRHELHKAMALVEENINSPDLDEILIRLNAEKSIMVVATREFVKPTNPTPDGPRGIRPETITETKEFTLSNGEQISLTFHAMITPVNATVSTLQMQLYIITAIMILVSVAIALVLSDVIAKPLVHLNESAKKLSKGNYNADFNGRGYLEVKELSDSLNAAAIELSKVDELRRELIANISHDLRTPLALIYSYAEMMQDFPDEITTTQLQTIMSETKRLTSLVNDLLDVSKLETGTMELHIREYNLTESVEQTVERFSELLRNDGYTIEFEHSEDVYVLADEAKITQALYNLLTNAVNYSREDKYIIVKQLNLQNNVRIEVHDHGDGIAPEDIPYIWDRYYKVDKKHKRAITGTGLGLSIVKKIFELHGAEYGVESEFGKGSVFWFRLELRG
ncbi:MAG: integral rane sensor signal transduction histidine kinase [Defluviitaleaceae bacterium]|nr:integral rane sensor signal transduction histidine kinase [Defluviitaleaceae bacterium]